MIDQGKKNLLGILINSIDYDATVEKVVASAESNQPLSVSALAVHGVMTGVLDAAHGFRLNCLDIAVPDGQPVRWALNWLYDCELKDRVYGPTLMLEICERASVLDLPIALYGSKPSVLKALAKNLKEQFPGLEIVDQQPSFFRQLTSDEQNEVIDRIKKSGAKIVFVGLGCPRQEVWVFENKEMLGMPAIAVGAAFDFHAGLLKQSPIWMQNKGLEWLFRLSCEPRRLWKRYLLLNPLYMSFLALQLIKLRSFQPRNYQSSMKTMRYG